MAKAKTKKDVKVILTLTEDEAAALRALLGKSNVGTPGGEAMLQIFKALGEVDLHSGHAKVIQFEKLLERGAKWRNDDSTGW